MSTVVTFRVWGELEKWYHSLPEREKATHIRMAIRRGIGEVEDVQMEKITHSTLIEKNDDNQSISSLESKLDNFNMWE